MNEKLEEYISIWKEEEKEQRSIELINAGLFEKVYSDDDVNISDYPEVEWDEENQCNRYYKKVSIDITDEEYEEFKKAYNSKDNAVIEPKNKVATVLTVIAWIVFIGGFIAGIAFGNVEVVKGSLYSYRTTEFSFAIAFSYWAVSAISGVLILGFAEVIKLLNAIKNNK